MSKEKKNRRDEHMTPAEAAEEARNALVSVRMVQ